MVSSALLIAVALAGAADPDAGAAQDAGASRAQAIDDLLHGTLAALDGDGKHALDLLARAEEEAPDIREIQDALGTAALLAGDRLRAQKALADRPSVALYWAMAQADGPGGLSRAREVLSAHARKGGKDEEPGALFMAALAFMAAGEKETADEILSRALKKAPSMLDDAFAPDPGIGLSRASVAALKALGAGTDPILVLAQKLLEKERTQEAVRIAEGLIPDPSAMIAARRVLIQAWRRSDPRRALEQVELILKADKTSDAARVAKVELLLRLHDLAGAKRALAAVPAPPVEHRARVDRARAFILLETGGDPKEALEAAEAAATEDPKSNEALLLLCRALLANQNVDRALAFAEELLARRPHDVDPFQILRAIHEAKGNAGKASALALRSDGFRADEAKVKNEVDRREKVIRAVRDAEAGLGIAGADAVRGEEPLLSLPIDLLLARRGRSGAQHAARDRILAACAPELSRFLRSTGSWARFSASVSPYGDVETVDFPLSAADPGRCAHAPQRTRRPKG